MNITELREKSAEELRRLLREKRQELRTVRARILADEHKNVRDIRVLRKTIARLHTLLTQHTS